MRDFTKIKYNVNAIEETIKFLEERIKSSEEWKQCEEQELADMQLEENPNEWRINNKKENIADYFNKINAYKEVIEHLSNFKL